MWKSRWSFHKVHFYLSPPDRKLLKHCQPRCPKVQPEFQLSRLISSTWRYHVVASNKWRNLQPPWLGLHQKVCIWTFSALDIPTEYRYSFYWQDLLSKWDEPPSIYIYIYIFWLVVSTPLKNICQLGVLFPIYGKIKNVPNHQVHI